MFLEVEVERISPNPNNRNKHSEEDIKVLAATIKAFGLINPIMIMPKGGNLFQIIAGEGRWLAVKQLGWPKIACNLIEIQEEDRAGALRLAENRARTFEFIGEALEFMFLHKQGWSVNKIAEKFGSNVSSISRIVAVGYFPESALLKVRGGVPLEAGKHSTWSLSALRSLLPLRIQKDDIDVCIKERRPLAELYDYSEVEKAIDVVNSGQVQLGADLNVYIAQRRLELDDKRREWLVQQELDTRLAEISAKNEQEIQEKIQEISKTLDAKNKEAILKVEKQLEETKRSADSLRQDKARLLDQMSKNKGKDELLAQKQRELDEKNKTLLQKDQEIKNIVAGFEDLRKKAKEEATKDASVVAQQGLAKGRKELDDLRQTLARQAKEQEQGLKNFYAEKLRQETEKLKVKAERTIQDGIDHFVKLCRDMDATMRNLILGNLGLMSMAQIEDLATQAAWLQGQIIQMGNVLSKKMEAKGDSVEKRLAFVNNKQEG